VPDIRVFDRIYRQMMRLGYLKRVVRRVTSTSTTSLDNLGNDLIENLTRKVQVPLNESRVRYIRFRLFDRVYSTLKKQANEWDAGSDEPIHVGMEIQDLYLADPKMPSGVGKLVKADRDKYPPLGINLGFIREGTYSANTRALSFLHFIPSSELDAFQKYSETENPLLLTKQQKLLLLYSLIENDGEVVAPFWGQLMKSEMVKFNDREAGDYLPEIYRSIIERYRRKFLSADIRERLGILEKSAESIAKQRGSERYSGGSARETSSRVRLEPYVDIGIFSKPETLRYEYSISPMGIVWTEKLQNLRTNKEIGEFLENKYFNTAAKAWKISATKIEDEDQIVARLKNAWKAIASPGGYAPIEEMSLVAGIKSLLDEGLVIEHASAREAIIAYQKAHPYEVRFTVNRMGKLAHARFLEKTQIG
jgi:hypothetical protein